jgi:hypothetical protein
MGRGQVRKEHVTFHYPWNDKKFFQMWRLLELRSGTFSSASPGPQLMQIRQLERLDF